MSKANGDGGEAAGLQDVEVSGHPVGVLLANALNDIKELRDRVETLEAENQTLRDRVDMLEDNGSATTKVGKWRKVVDHAAGKLSGEAGVVKLDYREFASAAGIRPSNAYAPMETMGEEYRHAMYVEAGETYEIGVPEVDQKTLVVDFRDTDHEKQVRKLRMLAGEDLDE